MRDHRASVESSAVSPGSRFPLPGADVVAAAWSDNFTAGVFPQRPDKAKIMSAAVLVLGATFLLFVPLGGALLLVTGGLGLAISSEGRTGGPATTTASHPPTSSSTDD
jgi:hypothetical protein